MKSWITLILLLLSTVLSAQNVHYFRVNMGPKFEQHQIVNTQQVRMLPHIDVGAGIYLGKRFSEEWSAEVGLLKNDYSARFEIDTRNIQDEEVVAFENFVYPTFTSYQLALLGTYRFPTDRRWSYYATAGVQLFIKRSLSREGTLILTDEINPEEEPVEEFDMVVYSNGFESGNLIFRADLGAFYAVNEDLSLDISLTARASNLLVNEFSMEYSNFNGSIFEKDIHIRNSGKALQLSLGIKYRINALD